MNLIYDVMYICVFICMYKYNVCTYAYVCLCTRTLGLSKEQTVYD